jgi:hypothetical protein
MMPEMQRVLAGLAVALIVLTALPAQSADNDFVLSRFGTFKRTECDSDSACGYVERDDELFRKLARDVGQVFAPRFLNPSSTLGEAGFAMNLALSMSLIDNDAEHWQKAVQNKDPSSALTTAHLQIRKGLPFSFEIAGDMAYLVSSEMFNLGAQMQWALNEGFYYFPDIAVRGTVNNLIGAQDLNLITAGWDISISKGFDIQGMMRLAPYLGYQQLHVIGSSRVLNAYPQDPRPPQFDEDDPSGRTSFSPEFVFSQQHEAINRFFAGTRLKVWVLNFALEAVLAEDVTQFTLGGGVDF